MSENVLEPAATTATSAVASPGATNTSGAIHALADRHRRRDDGNGRILIVVTGGTGPPVLANRRMRLDANLVQIVAVHVLTPATLTRLQVPWLREPGRRQPARPTGEETGREER